MKKCNKCHRVLDNSFFNKDSASRDGLYSICVNCRRKEYRKKHPDAKLTQISEFPTKELLKELSARGYFYVSPNDPLFEEVAEILKTKRFKIKENEENE